MDYSATDFSVPRPLWSWHMTGSTHNADYRLFLAVLRDARKNQHVTQLEMAERLGNTQSFVSKCERGERRIDLVEFVEFAEALGVGPEKLLQDYISKRAGSARSGKSAKRKKN